MRRVKEVIVTVNGDPSEESLKKLADEIVRQYLMDKNEYKENNKQS